MPPRLKLRRVTVIDECGCGADNVRCYKIDSCAFFEHYRTRFGEERLQTLISAYCEGPFQPLCKRLVFIARHGENPPIDLCPDGYQAGTGNKLIT